MMLQAAVRVLQGNKMGAVLGELHRSESRLAEALTGLADEQRMDHEIFHVARDLSEWSREHVRVLAEAGRDYGLDLSAGSEQPADDSLAQKAKHKGAEMLGRFHEPSLLLLTGLRHIHVLAAGVSVDWEVLAQGAQALKDRELLALAQECHPQTLRQLRWANAKVKEMAPQVIATG